MVVIWRGLGLVVPVIAFVVPVLGYQAFAAVFGTDYASTHRWVGMLVWIACAPALWFTGRALNGRLATIEQLLPHSDLGIQVEPAKHSFFYIPVEWTGVAIAALALLFLAADLMEAS